ncbi:DUF3526 domain-containing protein [Roseateles sp. DAIF2]|uniref:DUF3526 domain-containing protein n=1 Tax=Roseateles sp. DAIF2 TaxID=2714952 RepID=UPI0018A2AC75|nr:DUF3526 domain-containing protein [Roseateles sp. DAIF2]QPF76163.1 DUF3526 domain-containing protein [Roseateles sp. DAIF2]
MNKRSGSGRQAWWLVVYDLRALWRERSLLWLLGATLLVFGWALLQGARFEAEGRQAAAAAQAQQERARGAAQALARDYFAAPEAPRFAQMKWWRSPFDVRGYAFYEHLDFALRPALPGAALAVAQADVLPRYVRVRAESLDSARGAYDLEHPARLAVGRFDLMFCVVYLWPLVLLALGASVLTQDRETGRLAPLRLQGVAPGLLLLARSLARALVAGLVLALGIAALALLSGAVPADAAGAWALLQWSGLLLAYSLFWAGVSALICAHCQRQLTAAFAGFGAWVLLAILLPAGLSLASSLAAPVPGRELYVRALRDAGDAVAANRQQVLERFYDAHPQWRPQQTALAALPHAVTRIPRALEQERLLAPLEQQYEAARARRQALFDRFLWLSPVSLASEQWARLAGHDAQRQRRFMAEVAAHQGRLREFFGAQLQQAALRDERGRCARTCVEGYGFTAFEAVPRFTPSAALAAPAGAAAAPGALLAWALALLGLALSGPIYASRLSGAR